MTLRQNISVDLSSFATLTLDGEPASVQELSWDIVSQNTPEGLSLEGATLIADKVQRTLKNSPITIKVSYKEESAQAQFTFTDNALVLDIDYLNALSAMAATQWEAFYNVLPELSWDEHDQAMEELMDEKLATFLSTLPSSLPPLTGTTNFVGYFVGVEGALNNIAITPYRSTGVTPGAPEGLGSNFILAAHGPFSAQECQQMVTEVSHPLWSHIAIADDPSLSYVRVSNRKDLMSNKASVAAQCEDGDYVIWSSSGQYY